MGSSFNINDDSETVVKPLELVPGKREGEIGDPMGQKNIIQLDDHLIMVLDLQIDTDGTPIISQPRPESNLLTGADRIRVHIKILNEQWTNAMGGHGPSLKGPSGTKLLRQVHRSSRPLNIYLNGEAIFLSMESVVCLGEGNPIISRPEYNILHSRYHLILIFNKKVDPPRSPREVSHHNLKTHPLTLPHRIGVHL
jgi:hypothetical protein